MSGRWQLPLQLDASARAVYDFADPDDGCREQIAATYPQPCAGPGPAPRLVALHARLAQGRDVPGEGPGVRLSH